MGGHRLLLSRRHLEPAAEEALGAVEGVVFDEAGAVLVNFGPDVHLIGNEDGAACGEGLGDNDAEILRVRGKNEGVGGSEGSPFEIAADHTGPVDAVRDAAFGAELLKAGLGAFLIGAGDDEIDVGKLGSDFGEGGDEQIAAFFGVKAGHKEEVAAAAEAGNVAQEGFDLSGGIAVGLGDAVGDGETVPAIGMEAGDGEVALDGGGEENGAGIAEDAILQGPIEDLLDVFEGVSGVEPGVEGAVGEDGVRHAGAAGGGVDGDVGEHPDAVHHNAVVTGGVAVQPGP